MKNKKYYSLAIAAILFSLLSQNISPDVSALTTRNFSILNDNHMTQSYGFTIVCGDHKCKPGEYTKWSNTLWQSQKYNHGVVYYNGDNLPPGWKIFPCTTYTTVNSPSYQALDKNGNTWYHYCGKYADFETHPDTTIKQEQDMQKLLVSRAVFLIINNHYLPDSALVQPASNSRVKLVLWLDALMKDISEQHYNFAIRDASNYAASVNSVVTDPQYQTKVQSLFNDIRLMATNEARP